MAFLKASFLLKLLLTLTVRLKLAHADSFFAYPTNPATRTCDAKRTHASNACSERGDQLRGRHINFVFVGVDHFMEFNRDLNDEIIFEDASTGLLFNSTSDNSVYSTGTANGFLNDKIGWIASHAGFTYSAYVASGRCEADGLPLRDASYATNYKEAQRDVYPMDCEVKTPGEPRKGHVDAYLGMFFITNGRMAQNDFTIPFLANRGMSIGMLKSEKGTILDRMTKESMFLVVRPFNSELWYFLFVFLFILFVLLNLVENSNLAKLGRLTIQSESDLKPFVQEQVNTPGNGFDMKPPGEESPQGFLTFKSITLRLFYYGLRTIQAGLLGNEFSAGLGELSNEGRVLNLLLSVFSVILLSAYVASLTNILVAGVPHHVGGVDDLISKRISTCLPLDSAFTDWVKAAYPALITVDVPSFAGQIEGVNSGECDAVIAPVTNLEAHEATCEDDLKRTIDVPWTFGYMEHAIGVRKDFPELTDTLNYWTQELILSAPGNPLSFTYNSKNMNGMYESAVTPSGSCEEVINGNLAKGLGVESFLGPMFVGLITGVVALISSCINNRSMLSHRIGRRNGRTTYSLYSFMEEHHEDCANEADGTIKSQAFIAKYRNNKLDSFFQKNLVERLLYYYVKNDTQAYNLLKYTLGLLEQYLRTLDQLGKNGTHRSQSNAIYVSQVIENCTETIELLLWRAMREVRNYNKRSYDCAILTH
ncbi:hypothetical protein TrLO_g4942 [Triparma laevis f. longispina]|uniref:Ionotropic glutamate receptor C-terminal domain-containing protein n=1 Tax=Triparma laevis f. longispina TaxID=1714387 RepID=A0A9W7KYW5_9STRA|nr:hypothetical protein TrLO_g4942 [Triparma laevis f. longispina]